MFIDFRERERERNIHLWFPICALIQDRTHSARQQTPEGAVICISEVLLHSQLRNLVTRAPHLLFPQSQRATWGRSSGLALMRPWPAGELTGSADRFGVAWPGVAALPQEASAPQQAGPREC